MTDQDVLSEMQIALLEAPDGGASWPSEAWTREEALDALNANLQQLVRETHLVAVRSVTFVAAGTTSIALPAAWMATLDAGWIDGLSALRTPLGSVDAYEVDLADPTWLTPATPIGYLDRDQASRTLRLAPTPVADGFLDLLYVPRPATCTGNGVTLAIPQDYCYGVKWGALTMLLRKVGRMQWEDKAAYGDQRYELVKTLAEIILEGSYA